MIIEQITLHSNAGHSDKLYWAAIEKAGDGYLVNFSYGARTGSQTSGCKTVDPKNKRKPLPVALDKAQRIYNSLVSEKRNGSSAYHNYPECGHGNGNGTAGYSVPTQPASDVTKDVSCQLLTSIDNGEEAARFLLSPDYAAQQKFDGKRIILHVEGQSITGYNRSGKACGISNEIVAAARRFSETGPLMLDGEMISDVYYAFDILEIGGVNIRKWRFDQREAQLQAVTASRKCAAIVPAITEFTEKGKVALLEDMYARQLEGVVLKRVDSPYLPGRQRDQLKHKFVTSASFVVLKLNEKNSVQIGTFDDKGNMVENGNVTIRNKMFGFTLKVGSVVEVRYLYAFPDSNHVYQPRMLSTRDDIRPEDCKLSQLKYKGAM